MSDSVSTSQLIDGDSSSSSSSASKSTSSSHIPRSEESDDESDFLHIPQHEGHYATAFKAMVIAAIQARASSEIVARSGGSSKADEGRMSQCFASLANARLSLTWPPATDQPDCRLLVTSLLKADSTVNSDLLAGFTATSESKRDAKGKAAKDKKREVSSPSDELSSGGGPMPRTTERIRTFPKPSAEELEEAKKGSRGRRERSMERGGRRWATTERKHTHQHQLHGSLHWSSSVVSSLRRSTFPTSAGAIIASASFCTLALRILRLVAPLKPEIQ